jgi:lipid-A-disaccharide synthase-like uncharacterized protein
MEERRMCLLFVDAAVASKGFFGSFLAPLALLGYVGQAIFAGRFIVQWYVSEKKKQSVVPRAFWYMSLVGSVLLLAYSILKHEPVLFVGQLPGFVVYTRNLVLLSKAKAAASAVA